MKNSMRQDVMAHIFNPNTGDMSFSRMTLTKQVFLATEGPVQNVHVIRQIPRNLRALRRLAS